MATSIADTLLVSPQICADLLLAWEAKAIPIWEQLMLHYAVVFFVIALVAALFGFGGIAAGAMGIGKILFVVFLLLAVASFLFGIMRKG